MTGHPICLDASCLLAVLLPDEQVPELRSHLEEAVKAERMLIGPALLWPEVISSVRYALYRKRITTKPAEEVVQAFLQLPIFRIDHRDIHESAFQLASEYGLSRAYDSYYLACARLTGASLYTCDQALFSVGTRLLSRIDLFGTPSAPR